MLKNKVQEQSGITMVALVVTIVVLIILSTVSFGTISNSGIIEKAELAQKQSMQEIINEEVAFANMQVQLDEYIKSYTIEEVKEVYESKLSKARYLVNTYNYEDYDFVKIKYTGNELQETLSLSWFVDGESLDIEQCAIEITDIEAVDNQEINTVQKMIEVKQNTKNKEIEYVESTGNQYIDLGFKPKYNTRVVFDGMVIEGDCALFGARTQKKTDSYTIQYIGSDQYRMTYDSNENLINKNYEKNQRYLFDYNREILKIDDNIVTTAKLATFESNYNLYLFGMNTEDTIERMGNIRCYGCKVYDNDKLIRDLKPIIDKDGIVCMYNNAYDQNDMTTGKEYYYSKNTSLIHGDVQTVIDSIDTISKMINTNKKQEKVEYAEKLYNQLDSKLKTNVNNYETLIKANMNTKKYSKVQYIESTGTQYIDLQFVPNSDTRVVFDGMVIDGDTALFGAREGTGKRTFSVQYIQGDIYRNNYGTVQTLVTSYYRKNQRYVFDLNKNILKIDGQEVTKVKEQEFTSPCNLFLFGINTNFKVGNLGTVRCYSCQVYDNGVLIRDLIPVIDEKNKPALYDKIEKKYYYNQNTIGEDFSYEF